MQSIPEYKDDFYSDDFIKNPHPQYSKMRNLGPVVFLPKINNFAITRHRALKSALLDYKSFASGYGVAADDKGCSFVKGQIVSSDPPTHNIMRKAMAPPLMPKNINKIIPIVKEASKKLIKDLLERESFDGVIDLAQFLPLTIVRNLVGLPDFGRENMLKWAGASFNVIGIQNQRGKDGVQDIIELRKFIIGKVNLDTVKPGSWIERILKMVISGDLDEKLGNFIIRDYINPSLDTTISAISHLIYLLSKNNDEWQKLQHQPSLSRNAVAEAIRLGSPIRSFSRITTKEVEIENFKIPKNSRVMMLFASANRDELVYDNPNQFNINRNFNEHLGFGHGIHSCVGMHLAQIEMMSLLEAMIPYVKRIETGKPQPLMNNTICGFSKLPTKLIPI